MKLSVAVITYNHAPFIRQAMESVLAQQMDCDWEVVVGEDCSTDGTREIVLEYQRKYPDRIVPILRSSNVGGMQNANETFARCRGEYIAVLEGDDYWTSPEKLRKQIDFLDGNPEFAVCCHRAQILDELGSGQASAVYPWMGFEAGTYAIGDIIDSNFIPTCSTVYRSSVIQNPPSWITANPVGDWPRHILAAQRGKIRLLDEVMAVYRVHSGGIWNSNSQYERLRDAVSMLQSVDRHFGHQFSPMIRKTVARLYFEMAVAGRQESDRGIIVRSLLQCARFSKLHPPGRFVDWASLIKSALSGTGSSGGH